MNLISILLIAIGLAMDAFAVSLTTGLKVTKDKKTYLAIKSGIFFGIAQGVMPVIGWFLGNNFKQYIEGFDHWIAFLLLGIIGGKMAYEGLKSNDEESENEVDFSNKRMFILSIATSIDALAIGVSLGALNANIITSALIIGVVTMIICILGVYLGKICGNLLQGKAEVVGGIILICIGAKILLEHTGIIDKIINFVK
ncbi:manganese efflux pump MntP family protein [Clostridium carnis]